MRIAQSVLFTVVGILTLSSPVFSAPRTTPGAISCPQVIGDKRDGTYFTSLESPKTYPFQCFRRGKDVTKAGYKTKKEVTKLPFTGWFRLRLKSIRNTCEQASSGGPVLFLQIKETKAGVFGTFCPLIGDYSGVRSATGLTISGIAEYTEDPASSPCIDGKVKEHQYVELSRAVDGGAAYTTSYKTVKTCTSVESGTFSCSREYSGQAFLETHPIWPKVPDNINQLDMGCTTALTKCADCHQSLQGFPGLGG